jgi:hypothetical protein
MSTASNNGMCPHCGMGHTGTCPRIKAIDYYPDGTTKRVEYHEPKPVAWPMSPPVALPKFD